MGSAQMVNQEQIEYCSERGWITVVPNHRLCPGVNLLDGPIEDCRDLLSWIYNKGLEKEIVQNGPLNADIKIDYDHVFAFGTSSGGHLSLCLVSAIELLCYLLCIESMIILLIPAAGFRGSTSASRNLRHVRPLSLSTFILEVRTSQYGFQNPRGLDL